MSEKDQCLLTSINAWEVLNIEENPTTIPYFIYSSYIKNKRKKKEEKEIYLYKHIFKEKAQFNAKNLSASVNYLEYFQCGIRDC